jgi:hypothetical protein
VPLLGDLPVVGNLFQNNVTRTEQDRAAGVHHAQDRDRPVGDSSGALEPKSRRKEDARS